MLKNRITSLLSLIILISMMSSCAVTNPVTGKKQFFVMSEAKEIAMGKEYDPQIVAGFGLYENEQIQSYIDAKGQEMAAISHRSNLAYEFKILDSDVVNAFAVPGGYVYFTRGIMAHFNNEAEFAGVLGHEIGHVTARHTAVSQRNQMLSQIGLIAGIVAIPELASMAQPLSNGMQLLMLKNGRNAESQSDQLGVEYSSKIGYDAKEMADFFNTLARKQEAAGVSIPEFLSTHPDPNNRRETVDALAIEMQDKLQMVDPKIGRNSYLNMIDGLVYGPDPRQGFVEDNVFYHPDLKFQFNVPNSWQYQNSPQAFQMATADGKGFMSLTIAQGSSLQEAATNTTQGYNLTVQDQNQTTIGGHPAYVVIGVQQAAEGQTTEAGSGVKVKFSLIEYGGLIYNITGACLESDYNVYGSNFDNTMQSFKTLTDSDKLNRQPEKLDIVTVNQTGSLSSFLTYKGIPNERLEEFAVLNGMQLTDTVNNGMLIKVIE